MPTRELFTGEQSPTVRSDLLQLTIIEQSSLFTRLHRELQFVASRAEHEWQQFIADPFEHLKRRTIELTKLTAAWIKAPNRVAAVLSALTIILSVVLSAVFLEPKRETRDISPRDSTTETLVTMLPVTPGPISSAAGFNPESNGRVGLSRGTGEGSNAEKRKASGGGGGGNGTKAPAPVGAVPPPSEIPAPIVNPPRNPSLPLAGINIDPVLWKALPVAHYGDPRSNSQITANGPGTGGGMGDGDGQGIGEGDGSGLGRGKDGNTGDGRNQRGFGGGSGGPGCGVPTCTADPNRVFPVRDVAVRARVLSKPEPQYTEEARRNQISGTVSLRVVFTWSGEVTHIRAVSTLPMGLTERAIAAARQIKFIPAMRDGRPVSVHMQLEYNFNLY